MTAASSASRNIVFHRGTWTIGNFCYLEDLFVAPNARNRGVARALIEAVYADAPSASNARTLTARLLANARIQRR
jgi:GNAT superfamily N-acetyltransferase